MIIAIGGEMRTTLTNMSPIRETAVITAVAILLSFCITGSLYLLLFGLDNRFWQVMTMSIIVPWGISIPLGFVMSKQREKLVMLTNGFRDAQQQLREVNKQLERKANYDGMTGLLNRACFFHRLVESRENAAANVLMIVDVDRFKQINDTYGHPIGDRALILIAGVFRNILRKEDMIGRIGGEEFGIWLPNTSAEEGQAIGEMIRFEVENTTFEPHKGVRHLITVSIGFTSATSEYDRQLLLRNADCAMFEAKRLGRNRVVAFDPGMRIRPRAHYDQAQLAAAMAPVSNIR